MQLTTWNPFRELDQLHERMNKLFDDTLSSRLPRFELPATDIYEQDGSLVVESSLPSFKPEEVEVSLSDNLLEIKAERREEKADKGRNYLRKENLSGSYFRQFTLPKGVDTDKAEATHEHGILKVVIPMQELPTPKRLRIEARPEGKKTK